jgi:hypothetical protein
VAHPWNAWLASGFEQAVSQGEGEMAQAARRLQYTERLPDYILGPDGDVITEADLPQAGTTRWVPRRKAQVVAAVRGGLISLDDACTRYALTVEEFLSWQNAVKKFGLAGLRATHVQDYRPAHRH